MKTFLLISGGPGLFNPRDREHDVSWANYVTAPLVPTRTRAGLRAFKRTDEAITWMVFRPAYERRWTSDLTHTDDERRAEARRIRDKTCGQKKCGSYLGLLRYRATESPRNFNLVFFDDATEFWSKLARLPHPISRTYYWGHASGDLWLSLRHQGATAVAPDAREILTASGVSRHRSTRSRFDRRIGRRHIFYGCNTHTFARAWAQTYGVPTQGFEGKVDFSRTSPQGEPARSRGCVIRRYDSDGDAESVELESLEHHHPRPRDEWIVANR